jgi:hypothetical protein
MLFLKTAQTSGTKIIGGDHGYFLNLFLESELFRINGHYHYSTLMVIPHSDPMTIEADRNCKIPGKK